MAISVQDLAKFQNALPFWLSFLLLPLAWIGAVYGGWTVFLLPLITWYLFALLDLTFGLNLSNGDLTASDKDLFWYRLLTLMWGPAQFITLYALIAYVSHTSDLESWEKICLFFGVGVITGTIGINYSHELMHQKSRLERGLADALLAMVLYSHFRSEHLLVHHRYVGTPRDPVTARKGESFYRFYPRVLKECFFSAFQAEKNKLARKGLPAKDLRNPFWKYGALQCIFLCLAFLLGGWSGLGLFLFQAGVAIWQLELVNYIEHYGLTRKYLGGGKYEHVKPHHSWNAAHKVSNWLLINLQRHSDHHYKPNRRFPILQNYTESEAPQLPFSYPIMTLLALYPKGFRQVMHPKLEKWREMYYPEITQWGDYNKARHPMPQ